MRRRFTLALIPFVLFATSLLLAGKGDAAAGKAVYSKQCASCHGAEGEGKEAIAKMFKVTMRHLGSKEVQAKTDAELRKSVTEGNGKMKPVKGLSEKDLDNLIARVRTLAKK